MKKVTLTWTCHSGEWLNDGLEADMFLDCGKVWQTEERAVVAARGQASAVCPRCGTLVSQAHGDRPKASEMYEEYCLPDLPTGKNPIMESEK